MIRFVRGNLLATETEAVVNTVNTVGVMGKGIALQFKERFPENFKAYEAACEAGEVVIGRMFVTTNPALSNPKWIVNFPTKKHWRYPTKIEWVVEGLKDLRRFIEQEGVRSISIPPLGCGNGGLAWNRVKHEIEVALSEIDVDIAVFEPSDVYMAHAKQDSVKALTPARAMVTEMIRRYMILGFECTLLEVQKLAWFLERQIGAMGLEDPLQLKFTAHKYGPYSEPLRHLLDGLDGSYLHCSRRLSDASPFDTIWFDLEHRSALADYLASDHCKPYHQVMECTSDLIEGFESPLGMELLATVDWLVVNEACPLTLEGIKSGLKRWPGGGRAAAARKQKIFDDRLITLALDRLASRPWRTAGLRAEDGSSSS